MRRLKRNFIKVFMIALIISSMSMIAYAASSTYTYPSNGYVMEYSLTVTGSSSSSSGGVALTSTDDAAVAFVSIFGYKSSGSVVCSGSKYQDYYAYISKTGSSVVKYTSHHSLVDENYKPYGTSISKTVSTN